MPRKPKPTFITELPLVVSHQQDAVMLDRFEAGRRLTNALLGDGLKRLNLMRDSKAWAQAKALPKGEPKSLEREARNEAFKACNHHFGFTEYALQAQAIQHKNAAGFDNRLGSHETQKIATRVFASLKEYAFGKRGKPRFKGKHRPLHSLEGKNNAAGIRWSKDTATVSWGAGFCMPVRIPSISQDPYLHECLQAPTKYCRIVWRMEQSKRRYFVQLIQDGVAPAKYSSTDAAKEQVVGLDIGPSTVAIVSEAEVALVRLAPSVEQPWKRMRTLQRAQDRSRRASNPENYTASGDIRRGAKRWVRSVQYVRRQHQLQELERRLCAARKRDHGELANKILALGTTVQTETISYKGWQKNFGRSSKVRGSGMFVALLGRKAASAGGSVVELNTRTLKMSQYDHITQECIRKPLSQRWHTLGKTHTLVQRDCYSAFLAMNVRDNQHDPAILNKRWVAADPLLRRAGLCVDQPESGEHLCSPTVRFTPLSSDRVARQRRFVRGHVRDV
jgi:putative transposase